MTEPGVQEVRAFERLVLQVRTMLEEMNGGLAIAAKRSRGPRADLTTAGHLSWMLAVSLREYTQGRVERAQRFVGYVQGTIGVKYGLSRAELARAGLWSGPNGDPENV